MDLEKNKLKSLKENFNREVAKAKLTDSTITRYQSWIRRYLIYCKNHNLEINCNSSVSFLKNYQNYYTRRQGFYALRFLNVRVIRQKMFVRFENTTPEIQSRAEFCLKFYNLLRSIATKTE